MKKLKSIKYCIKALLELRARGFSEEEASSCANITAALEKLIAWHKALPTYREGDAVNIELNTGHHDIVGN